MTPYRNWRVNVKMGPPTAFGKSTYGYELTAQGGGMERRRVVDANVGEGWYDTRDGALVAASRRVKTIEANQRTGRSLRGT
jgi:hypothetical protein